MSSLGCFRVYRPLASNRFRHLLIKLFRQLKHVIKKRNKENSCFLLVNLVSVPLDDDLYLSFKLIESFITSCFELGVLFFGEEVGHGFLPSRSAIFIFCNSSLISSQSASHNDFTWSLTISFFISIVGNLVLLVRP